MICRPFLFIYLFYDFIQLLPQPRYLLVVRIRFLFYDLCCHLYTYQDEPGNSPAISWSTLHILPLTVIPLGYPTNIEKPKDKYNKKQIHYNGW